LRKEEAEIEPLIVSKAYRGKGIGKRLIERVVSEARKMGVRYLSIKPVARNVNTIRWLHKQGFKNLGHIELFISFSEYAWKPGPEIMGVSSISNLFNARVDNLPANLKYASFHIFPYKKRKDY